MSQPLLSWDSADDTVHPQLVWRNKLDNRYLIEVHRTDGYSGKLYIFDHDKNDQEIFSLDVGLSYGATFGPDVADVQEWQEKALDFIDNTYNKQ
ncbi:hypothetical protein A2833_02935 [Candidatus Azambacteria bacterium RIFCSPHIGHO2_01_FULL_44_55]|uniref:Uncharacterized protein n=1 Tax=Candidatus Azambacteria bacterium RIFCSPLOWO2_02_FULL_44_14 TaxID=1797306 RepID=A0A1F5CBW7_9BACT|nr:MAG: hypothetical protein A3A18_02825 [Candidatus Azambacteria bacterium RIFCSPLOWO2_01_FULL_44_84]OGD33242.1 MAG: hypothetical protein A3C78_03230 [Candidatus Azambacteria bacterium RIFCSPHIGHO2_02_FULL_45_18]OGD40347.1 MAG: hypothetical protein A3I30_03590 [Candidatus Azambacteria bacterium RIFCSPLOWO2_02_FULL_44_14]OGD40710.1 MAG: hypothetical protein A2833_02935 [Candidatus Azambacteria bacterium RIFCSPHIGHO2_01_FULL_44_55]OGD52053.1 MAG: hypothetical protein A2608_01800 [Candidatus Azam